MEYAEDYDEYAGHPADALFFIAKALADYLPPGDEPQVIAVPGLATFMLLSAADQYPLQVNWQEGRWVAEVLLYDHGDSPSSPRGELMHHDGGDLDTVATWILHLLYAECALRVANPPERYGEGPEAVADELSRIRRRMDAIMAGLRENPRPDVEATFGTL